MVVWRAVDKYSIPNKKQQRALPCFALLNGPPDPRPVAGILHGYGTRHTTRHTHTASHALTNQSAVWLGVRLSTAPLRAELNAR